MKSLWIMRHGMAKKKFQTDRSRELSVTGRAQALDVARQLRADKDDLPRQMLVSPFVRTQQTAQIVHQTLDIKTPFEVEELLVYSADYKMLATYLLASDFDKLIIVSHMPLVANLCQYLAAENIFSFQTAQVVKLDFISSAKAKLSKIYLPAESIVNPTH